MMTKKNTVRIIYSSFLCWWIVYSSSFYYGSYNKYTEVKSDNKEYKVVIYSHLPISPYSIFKILIGDRYFFVLYEKGEEKYKTSPLLYVKKEALHSPFIFPENSSHEKIFIHPTNNGYKKVSINE